MAHIPTSKSVALRKALTRLVELEAEMRKKSSIERAAKRPVVAVGSAVWIKDAHTVKKVVIVPKEEANPFTNHISTDSPLGSALLGKHVNDIVQVVTSFNRHIYVIAAISIV